MLIVLLARREWRVLARAAALWGRRRARDDPLPRRARLVGLPHAPARARAIVRRRDAGSHADRARGADAPARSGAPRSDRHAPARHVDRRRVGGGDRRRARAARAGRERASFAFALAVGALASPHLFPARTSCCGRLPSRSCWRSRATSPVRSGAGVHASCSCGRSGSCWRVRSTPRIRDTPRPRLPIDLTILPLVLATAWAAREAFASTGRARARDVSDVEERTRYADLTRGQAGGVVTLLALCAELAVGGRASSRARRRRRRRAPRGGAARTRRSTPRSSRACAGVNPTTTPTAPRCGDGDTGGEAPCSIGDRPRTCGSCPACRARSWATRCSRSSGSSSCCRRAARYSRPSCARTRRSRRRSSS